MDIKAKKFIVLPLDAADLLMDRYSDEAKAIESAKDRCSNTGQTMYVVEMKSSIARADRPVKVTTL